MLSLVLLSLLGLLVLALALVLLIAAGRPDVFELKRSMTVNAPPARVFALIHDLRAFNTWNPYNRKDPSMRLTYRGPDAGPGAGFDFAGNGQVGSGSIDITGEAPAQRVDMRLRMTAPMKADNAIVFALEPRGEATEVTWSMRGSNPFLGKVMGVIFDMDRMVGRDFEAGLAELKSRAERA